MARKTLTAQVNALHTRRLGAIDVFHKAAVELESTAAALQELADQARVEASERHAVAEDALTGALDAKDKARRIRELVG